MKKGLHLVLLLAFIAISGRVASQCKVKAFANPVTVLCGDTVNLSAKGDGITKFKNDFGGANPLQGWQNTSSGFVGVYCGSNSPVGNPYLWFGGSSNSPRFAVTPSLDLTTGGTICFYMRYSNREGGADCENPDADDEGVHVQYSVDNGANWSEIQYWNPNGGADPQQVNWNQYCVNIPPGAQTSNTLIRWVQLGNTGDAVTGWLDHWGIDDVEIVTNDPAARYVWSHTGISKPTADTPPIVPTQSGTYTVTFTTGSGCTANSSVNVVVTKYTVTATSSPSGTLCPGAAVKLTGSVGNTEAPPTVCGVNSNNDCRGNYYAIDGNIGGPVSNTDNNFAGTWSAQSYTGIAQLIYTAAELQALGLKAGKITKLGFNIVSFPGGSGRVKYADSFIIKITCTNRTDFANRAWVPGMVTVYTSPGRINLNNGWNEFTLNQSYNWDGVSNIAIQLCHKNNQPGSGFAFLEMALQANETAVYRYQGTSSNSSSNNYCNPPSGPWEDYYRPIIRFGMCPPYDPDVKWLWTPSTFTYTPNDSSKVTNTNVNTTTTFTVQAKPKGSPDACYSSAQVTVNVAQLGTVDAQFDPVCAGSTLNLKAIIAGSPPGLTYSWTGPGGWTSTAQNPTRNPGVAGWYYVNVSNGSCTGRDSINVTLDTPPVAGRGYRDTLCQSNTSYNLALKLTNSPQPGGTWSADGSPSGAPGLSGNMLNASLLTTVPGDYRFKYTVTNNNACGPRDTIVNIHVKKAPFAGEDSTFNICNNVGRIFLFPRLKKSTSGATADAGGAWSDVSTTSAGAAFNTATGELDVSALPTGTYKFRYAVTASQPCPADDATITVSVINNPNTGISGAVSICNDGGKLNLFTGLGGSPDRNGNWTALNGTGGGTLADSLYNPALATAGTYRFKYEIFIPGCPLANDTVTVTLNKRPNAGKNGDTILCESAGNFNLFLALDGTPQTGGSWKNTGTGASSTGTFTPAGQGGNTFNFEYRIAGTGACADSAATVKVDVLVQPDAGKDNNAEVCFNGNFTLSTLLDAAAEPGGKWYKQGIFGGKLDSLTGDFDASGADTGNVKFRYIVRGTQPCKNDTSVFTLHINGYPVISNANTACSANRTTYSVTFNISGGHSASYSVTPAGTLSGTNPRTYTSSSIASGVESTFIVSDAKGCRSDTLVINRDCNCITRTGTVDPTPISLCEGSSTPDIYTGGFISDGNDIQKFYLHKGSGSALSGVVAVGNSTVFAFNPARMSFDSTYYISPVAADDSSGNVRMGDVCLQVTPGTPVVWHANPNAALSGAATICPGESTDLVLNFSAGKEPFTVLINNGSATPDSLGGFGPGSSNITVNPLDTITYRLMKIYDSNNCFRNVNGPPVTIYVNDAAIGILQAGVACADATNPGSFFIDVEGPGQVFTAVYSNSLNNSKTTVANIREPGVTVNPPFYSADTAITYVLDTIYDNTGSICPGVMQGSFTIWPKPTAIISGGGVYCPGQQATLNIGFTGVGPWEVVYTDGTNNFTSTQNNRNATISFTVSQPGTYTYSLVSIKDMAAGSPQCTGTVSGQATIIVNSPPAIDLIIEETGVGRKVDDEYCEGDGPRRLYFVVDPAKGSGSVFNVTYTENNQNAKTIQVTRPESFVIVNPGPGLTTYRITSVSDTSSAGCNGTSTAASIKVNPTPTVNITSANQEICFGDSATITFQVSGNNGVRFSLRGTGADTKNYSVAVAAGQTTVSVKVGPTNTGVATYRILGIMDGSTPVCTGFSPDSVKVTVNPRPTADFTTDSIELCSGSPLVLTYTLTGNGSITGFYNDPAGSGQKSLSGTANSYTYNAGVLPPGDYTYQFNMVRDSTPAGCTGSSSQSTFVKVRPVPSVLMTLSDNPVCQGDSVNLIFECDGFGPFEVDFTDDLGTTYATERNIGNLRSVRVPSDVSRYFRVTEIRDGSFPDDPQKYCFLRPTDSLLLVVNQLPTASLSGTSEVCSGQTPVIDITVRGSAPFTVQFRNLNPGGANYSQGIPAEGVYQYNFNPAPSDSLVLGGLTVVDNNQCSNTGSGTAYVNVNPVPDPDFTLSPPGGCSPLPVTFTHQPEGTYQIGAMSWNFGDGSPVRQDTVTVQNYIYTERKTYPVTLTVTSRQGCVGTVSHNVTVYPDPVADFTWEPSTVTIDETNVRFYNKSTGGQTFEWTMGNMDRLSEYEPLYQFPPVEEVTYPICLTTISGFGCTDTICKELKVKGVVLTNIPNTFTPNGDDINEVWLPVTEGFRAEMYHLVVYDRWGGIVFETHDLKTGWDGKDLQNELCKQDIYIYHLTGKSKYTAEKLEYKGKVCLLR